MALYPQTTCFYKAIVNSLPRTGTDDYELLFEDNSYADNYAPPLGVPQRYVIAYKKSSWVSHVEIIVTTHTSKGKTFAMTDIRW